MKPLYLIINGVISRYHNLDACLNPYKAFKRNHTSRQPSKSNVSNPGGGHTQIFCYVSIKAFKIAAITSQLLASKSIAATSTMITQKVSRRTSVAKVSSKIYSWSLVIPPNQKICFELSRPLNRIGPFGWKEFGNKRKHYKICDVKPLELHHFPLFSLLPQRSFWQCHRFFMRVGNQFIYFRRFKQ